MVMCMLGPAQIVLLAALALIIFGPKRLPEIGRSLGNALREFQRASAEFMEAVNRPPEEQEPEPPPVKNIEYPVVAAAADTQPYEALPYGSDFTVDAPGAVMPESATAAAAGSTDAAQAPKQAESGSDRPDLSPGVVTHESAAERKALP